MWVEPVAVFLAAVAVLLQWREHRLAWWCILLSSILYIEVFARAQLFWDATLQTIFIALAIRGIASWGRARDRLSISTRPALFHRVAIGAALTVAFLLTYGSVHFRGLSPLVAFADGFIFSFSVLAVALTERKVLECWIYWIVIDIVAALLYWTRGLELTAMLYAFYVPLAVFGYRSWAPVPQRWYTPPNPC
jgi:nicotinamide mononucleotide transporter